MNDPSAKFVEVFYHKAVKAPNTLTMFTLSKVFKE